MLGNQLIIAVHIRKKQHRLSGIQIQVKEIPVMEFIGEELGRQLQKKSAKDTLTELDLDQEYDSSFGKRLKEHLDFVYPYAADVTLHSKMSVSELKKMGQLTDDGEAEMPFESVLLWPEETVDASPDALGIDAAESICEMCGGHATESAQEMSGMPADSGAGADRGTAYHRALELLPFDQIRSRSDVEAWLDSSADYLLFDNGMGAGQVFDWSVLGGIDREFFLAGGLQAENLTEAMETVRPYAVDLSSGIESNRKKDPEKMRRIMELVEQYRNNTD